MKDHTTLTFIAAFVMFAAVGMVVLAPQEVNAQLPDNNAITRYSQALVNKLCQDNPFRSHEIPPIVIPGITSGKNGGIAVYGNANATGHGQNGPISIGGGYNDKSGTARPYNANLPSRGGNGGIALCGTANGENATNGG
ncbi:MAG: hypothetical protein WAK17_28250 [Candidatus Nitrosopolaris sp.]|jgi:hypothetical protein